MIMLKVKVIQTVFKTRTSFYFLEVLHSSVSSGFHVNFSPLDRGVH